MPNAMTSREISRHAAGKNAIVGRSLARRLAKRLFRAGRRRVMSNRFRNGRLAAGPTKKWQAGSLPYYTVQR